MKRRVLSVIAMILTLTFLIGGFNHETTKKSIAASKVKNGYYLANDVSSLGNDYFIGIKVKSLKNGMVKIWINEDGAVKCSFKKKVKNNKVSFNTTATVVRDKEILGDSTKVKGSIQFKGKKLVLKYSGSKLNAKKVKKLPDRVSI